MLTQASRDAAAALLLAMQAFDDPSGHAMQPDEMHCWYTDAHDAADVASQAADTLKLLTTNASTVPATTGAAPSIAAAPSLIHATPLSAHTVAVEPALAGSPGANGTPPPAAAASHTAETARVEGSAFPSGVVQLLLQDAAATSTTVLPTRLLLMFPSLI